MFSRRQDDESATPDPRALAGTQALLDQVLPALQLRVRRRHVAVLAEEVVSMADPAEGWGLDALGAQSWADGLVDPEKPLALASLGVLLIRLCDRLHLELAQLDRRVAEHVEGYSRAEDELGRKRRLEQMIAETARDRKSARKDQRALKRYLDFDALRERFDNQRDLILVRLELAIMAIGPAVEQALAAAGGSHTARTNVSELLRQAEPLRFLVDQLSSLRRWPTRLACLESLERVLDHLGLPTPILSAAGGHRREVMPMVEELRQALEGVAMDRDEHEWVQAKAITCMRRVDVGAARKLMAARLGHEGEVPDPWPQRDFLVRRLIIAELCVRARPQARPSKPGSSRKRAPLPGDPADLEMLLRALELSDPSEHVRMAHCEALMTLAAAQPDAVATWARYLTRTEGADGSADDVELPRVRARACLALSEALAETFEHAADETLEEVGEAAVDSLATSIANDGNALVARVACEQAVSLIEVFTEHPRTREQSDRIAAHAGRFEEALHACLRDEGRSAVIHEAASAALEGIDAALRPERKAWTEALAAAIDNVHSGTRARIELPKVGGRAPDEQDLARILAMLTRNDWGVDVEPQGPNAPMTLRRGDHRVKRLWRIIHELRHPANNKRQAFRHTTGRSYRGRLRAHPGRLDEVTATVVPGERLHLDAEGGWARHLPLVDDIFGLPWLRGGDRRVALSSSHGRTTLHLGGSFFQRLKRRLRLNIKYAELAELRRRALIAEEPIERRRFLEILRNDYGVEAAFEAHPSLALGGEPAHARPVPKRLAALFPPSRADKAGASKQDGAQIVVSGAQVEASQPTASASLLPAPILLVAAAPDFGEWMRDNVHYFLTLEGNSQEALGLYALGLAMLFLGSGYARRRVIAEARAAIPLSVGGWGTRGKSGTERLKAGLFHGLGFRTFSKTTGCEAMFIHASPGGPQVEIFTFRPYGKATIWEQRDLLTLAAGLESEVFLWECMALNPEYVDILQRGWMRDDYATITNTYPDHEDIQGPAGIDVAGVIGRFVPEGQLVISSELGFNPVLRDSARERGSEFIELGDYEGDLLPDDLLGLFPYSEHPRNIALVTELARQLGIDPELAIVNMADYVYPDLGVLKRYPEVVVRSRRIEFVNGCSANERAGFLNNWRRTGCDAIATAADPAKMVVTVVNNRDDRVSRSEVFSRLLVNDVEVDAHVLIGTNLSGLLIFLDRALENFVAEQELVDDEGLQAGGAGHTRARTRLRNLLRRVRAPVDDWWAGQLGKLLELGFAAMGRRFDIASAEAEAFRARVEALRAEQGALEFEAVKGRVSKDGDYVGALDRLWQASAAAPELAAKYEVSSAPNFEEFRAHFDDRVARAVIAGRFDLRLEKVLDTRDSAGLTSISNDLRKSWIGLFKGQLHIVWDAGSTGDQVIDRASKAVPVGVHATVLGTQNIKGTGLDFIYRWLALDAVVIGLSKLESDNEQIRLDALRALDSHSDFGFTDTGTLVTRLPDFKGGTPQEVTQRKALLEKAKIIHQQKLSKLSSSASGAAAKGGKFWTWIEGWIDFIDGAVRYRQSRALVDDLINYRVSHNRMAVEMREIYARAKGGWLGKYLAAKVGLEKKGEDEEEEEGEAPALAEGAPASAEPAPVSAESAPASAEPAPVSAESAPASVEPAPSSAEPAPASAEPAPGSVEPAPASAESTERGPVDLVVVPSEPSEAAVAEAPKDASAPVEAPALVEVETASSLPSEAAESAEVSAGTAKRARGSSPDAADDGAADVIDVAETSARRPRPARRRQRQRIMQARKRAAAGGRRRRGKGERRR
ncbi:hypothetical protein G6O69_34030 [Pseudenhygromyxa sp. WMMC2535]|uniref:hypothetical protein n=1 Tax=Pseudenhygromyxa sp. WMMC2535 TaxID=2712867 RepID=UPI0015528B10|nr:hypothetical protein [Pseudenhygromyxa sp. WMMC2535]NVB42890.1 hypothetical protein [Pseudenhygromyxa sp. WMMC2535]